MTDLSRATVSVIIPVVNEERTIVKVIRALLDGSDSVDLEVLVADGRSSDSTRGVIEELSAHDHRIRLVDNPARVTPEGLNAAIRVSRGEIIVRMDGHAQPDPGYLAACLAALRSSGAWNVGGRMRKIGGTRAARAASAATTSPFGIGGGQRFHLVTMPQDVDSVWLGCWPRWVFERVGLFDPELVQDQDEELNQRIIDAGGRIRFDPAISAGYLSRASWRGLWRQYFRYGMYKVRAIQKRPSILRARHLVPAALVALVIGVMLAGLATPWGFAAAITIVTAWLIAAVYFAMHVAREFEASVADVVLAYACLHVGYGLGMWVGFIRFAPRWFIDRRGAIPRLDPNPSAT